MQLRLLLGWCNRKRVLRECTMMQWRDPGSPENRQVIRHLQANVLEAAQRSVVEPVTPIDLYDPPWMKIERWLAVESAIRQTMGQKRRGVFVEVGAGAGVFKSHTSWLETSRGWTGLLIEPRPDAYAQLRRRRKAVGARACVSDYGYNKKEVLWMPSGTEELPEFYREIALSRSTLMTYVANEDRLGSLRLEVQCFTLNALIIAAMGFQRPIDFLMLDTSGGEWRILETLEQLNVKSLMVKFNTDVDKTFIKETTERLNLRHYPSKLLSRNHFMFFLSENTDLNMTQWQEG
ncbi:putative Methyltransferase FkbM domain-containing protein 1 [Homarus americanus]|uniref:Putative Methyltransferase FkbM domain-containing protein 1 n=1 Tax=Homarus americanus TaxID=6706 RepID=A0A8J5MYB8_HOMAM|nr:putative Methyltransferase FkbM domain-containing protein 1 [Homarus americanus]